MAPVANDRSVVDFRVRRADVDPYGIVHHPNYVIWMEEAGAAHVSAIAATWWPDGGVDVSRWRLVAVDCRYIHALTWGDHVQVTTTTQAVDEPDGSVQVTLRQTAVNLGRHERSFEGRLAMSFDRREHAR